MLRYLIALCCVFVSCSGFANNKDLETFGDIAQIGIPASAAIVSMLKGDNQGLGQLAEGAVYTAGATHLLKFTIDERRPDGSDNNSFPSGHTSAATQGAAYLQFRYGAAYGIPAYTLAAVVGYSRVESDHHYWHDVAAGALLATGIQYLITVKNMGYFSYVFPYVDGKEVGLYAHVDF